MFIHYRPSDGEIFGYETGTVDPVALTGLAIAELELEAPPDRFTQKITGGKLVEKSAAELAASRALDLDQVKRAIFAALQASDHFVLPDRDDLEPARRDAWIRYRKMLRNLKSLPSATEMIEAWLIDPDGNDPIAQLRETK